MALPKIVHLTSVHPPSDTRIFLKECSSLAEVGYPVTLVVPHSKSFMSRGVEVVAVPKCSGRLGRMLKTTWSVYRAGWRERGCIYHFHDPELVPIALLLKMQGKKVIYDVHEDVPRQILSKYWISPQARWLVSQLTEIIEDIAAKKFDALVLATPSIKKRFESLNKNSINVNNYPILGELESPKRSKKEPAFAYVGGVTAIRGLLEMVQAMDSVDAQLLVAGKFAGPNLREKVEQMPGWQNVKVMGHLDRPQVAELLSRSVAGLVLFHPEPNHVNAQPNKMFEYMSAGLPVIASNFPLWKEIIEGSSCGICVDPLNPLEISQAMQWILDNPEQAQEMGRNGYKAVVEKYNWDVEAIKLKKLYQDLLQ